MPLSTKAKKYAGDLFLAKMAAVQNRFALREAAARKDSAAPPGPWLVQLYSEEMDLAGRALLDSYYDAFETEGSLPDEEDSAVIVSRLDEVIRARAAVGKSHAERSARIRGTGLVHSISAAITRASAETTSNLTRELGVWIQRKQLKAIPAPSRSWLADPPTERDGLLSLAGRQAFDRDLPEAISTATPKQPLSLLYMDIDNFKQVNDEYGHLIGDAALRAVAEEIRIAASYRGKPYRYGGDELVLLLPNTHTQEAAATAERLWAAVESAVIVGLGRSVTISIGIATVSENLPPNELISRADKAMYEAKRTRTRVVVREA